MRVPPPTDIAPGHSMVLTSCGVFPCLMGGYRDLAHKALKCFCFGGSRTPAPSSGSMVSGEGGVFPRGLHTFGQNAVVVSQTVWGVLTFSSQVRASFYTRFLLPVGRPASLEGSVAVAAVSGCSRS